MSDRQPSVRILPNSPQYEDEEIELTPFLTEVMPITETLHVVRYWYWLDSYFHCRYKLDHAGRPAQEVPSWDGVKVVWPVMT